jgi:hypothetical protein
MALRLRRGTDAERLIMEPPAAGELIYTTDTKAVYVGDGETVGGLPVSGAALDIDDLGNVVIAGDVNPGDVIQYDGTKWISAPSPDKTGNVYGADSTLLIDTDNSVIVGPIVASDDIIGDLVGDVTGNVTGDVVGNLTGNSSGFHDGDVAGSVFADDSGIMLDAQNLSLHVPTLQGNKQLITPQARATLELTYDDMGDLDQSYGEIIFSGRTTAGLEGQGAKIVGGKYGVFIQNDFNTGNPGTWAEAETATITYQGIGFGTYFPQAELDIRGNAQVTGFVQFGSLTTAERDALTAANGMVIYNTTNNKFEGYQNGGWINLDDGLAAS